MKPKLLVIVFGLLAGTIFGVYRNRPGELQRAASSDPQPESEKKLKDGGLRSITELLQLLRRRVINAQIHEALFSRYKVPPNTATFVADGETRYSEAQFPVELGDNEEWPATLSGVEWIFAEPVHARMKELLQDILNSRLDDCTDMSLVLFQSEIWVAFEVLYRTSCLKQLSTESQIQVREMLFLFAKAMRHTALPKERLLALPQSNTLRKELLEVAEGESIHEYFSLEAPQVHDVANGFRRVIRIYVKSSHINLQAGDNVEDRARETVLGVGDIALLEESAIAISDKLELVPTEIPVLLKRYKVEDSGGGETRRSWHMYRLANTSGALTASQMVHMSDGAEAWAMIDLPNIPGISNRPAFRAELKNVCAECHAGKPMLKSFNPGFFQRDSRYWRLTKAPQSFTSARVTDFKSMSLEFDGLAMYWVSQEGAR